MQHLSPYKDRRVVSIFIMGIAQGLPWVMIGSMLTLWLKDAGISRTDIGYAALIFTVYAINFIWSPLVDVVKIRLLGRLGQRQSWVFLCQVGIAASCFIIADFDPQSNAKHTVLVALIIAFFSSTQDIAIDAYRVDSFVTGETGKISAAAGMITAGWWTGYSGIGALPLFLSDNDWSWPQLYVLLGTVTAIMSIITTLLPKPKAYTIRERNDSFREFLALAATTKTHHKLYIGVMIFLPFLIIFWSLTGSPGLSQTMAEHSLYLPCLILGLLFLCGAIGVQLASFSRGALGNAVQYSTHSFDRTLAWVLTALVAPLREFFSRNGVKLAVSLLAFILLFKIGEAFLGRMSIVFYKEVGFTNTQIATYSKLLTWWLTVIFALVGGLVNAKMGLVKGLMISGIAMAITNLAFATIAIYGPHVELYAFAIVVDGFAAAWSTVAFVSFISLLCNHTFSATQYALMASLSNLGRTTLSSMSGQIVDWMDGNWALFFLLTTLMVIPSLLLLWKMRPFVNNLLKTNVKN